MKFDEKYITIAISLAKKGCLESFPNPPVGCVIVECDLNYANDKIVGFGFTDRGGRPHAEYAAINMTIFHKKKKYICYSTLEPCSHRGRAKSCVDKIIESPIDEVVFSLKDPDFRMRGKSITKLIENKVKVRFGLKKSQVIKLYKGYFLRKIISRPYVILKIASTVDGKITTPQTNKKWITNSLSRKYVHYLRSKVDGILIGSNTLRNDDPSLDCRIKGLENSSPIRIILSRKFDFSNKLKIFRSTKLKTIFFTLSELEISNEISEKKNIRIFYLSAKDFNLKFILKKLSDLGISNLMVEGGSTIYDLFLKHRMVDSIYKFTGKVFSTLDGLDGIDMKKLTQKNKYSFNLNNKFQLKGDNLEIYENRQSKLFFERMIENY